MTTAELINFNVSTKAQNCINAIIKIPTGVCIDFGTLSNLAKNGNAALATSNLRHKLYECNGLEFVLPLHRISSKNDPYGCIDGATCVGKYGRNVKIAIREIEGVFSSTPIKTNEKCPICKKKGRTTCSKKPSIHGLPAPKPIVIKKAKNEVKGSKEEAKRKRQNMNNKSLVHSVDASTIKTLVARLTNYIQTFGIDIGDAYKHLEAIMVQDDNMERTSSEPCAKKRKC